MLTTFSCSEIYLLDPLHSGYRYIPDQAFNSSKINEDEFVISKLMIKLTNKYIITLIYIFSLNSNSVVCNMDYYNYIVVCNFVNYAILIIMTCPLLLSL